MFVKHVTMLKRLSGPKQHGREHLVEELGQVIDVQIRLHPIRQDADSGEGTQLAHQDLGQTDGLRTHLPHSPSSFGVSPQSPPWTTHR